MKKQLAFLMTFIMVVTSLLGNCMIVSADAGENQSAQSVEVFTDEITDVSTNSEGNEIEDISEISLFSSGIEEVADVCISGDDDVTETSSEDILFSSDADEEEVDSTLSVQSDDFEVESIAVYTDDVAVTSVDTDNTAVTSEDADEESSETWSWSYEKDTGTLTISGSGPMDDYPFASAVPWWTKSIECVVVEEGITSIGAYSFYNNGFTSIELPSTLKSIGDYAFCDAELRSITLPEKLESIGECAFSCTKFTSIELPDTLKSIGSEAFADSNLKSIVIPGSVVTIGSYAFERCINLQSVELESGVKEIGIYAFKECIALSSVLLPDSLTSIGMGAFSKSTLPADTVIPENAQYDSAFGYTPWLLEHGYGGDTEDGLTWQISFVYNEELMDPDSDWTSYCVELFNTATKMLTIDGNGEMQDYNYSNAPWSDYTYNKLNIGAGVTRIGKYAFYDSKFTDYVGGDDLTEISEYAFERSTWLSNQTGDYIAFADILLKYSGSEEELDLSSYKGIVKGVFKGNTTITSVILSDKMTKIEDSTFYGCTGLTEITIPDSVTSIGKEAFYRCIGLTEITIPASVTSIGSYAFASCSNLIKVNNLSEATIGDDVFSYTLYEESHGTSSETITWQFDGEDTLTILGTGEMGTYGWKTKFSSSIENVIIGEGITSIAANAFSNMTELETVSIPSTVKTIGSSAFYNTGIKAITLPKELTSIGYSAFYGTSITTVTLPEGLTLIGSSAFESTDLTDITIPKSVTSIGASAFANCENLKTVTIKTEASLYDSCFYGCNIENLTLDCDTNQSFSSESWNNVEQLQLTSNVTAIADYQFQNMTSLKSVSFGENVSSIGAYAFAGCTSLQKIKIPVSVKTIGMKAFADCTALAKVTFEEGLETIGAYAFLTCPNLTEVTIPFSVTEIGRYAFHYDCRLYADSEDEKEYYHYEAYDTTFIMHGYINTEAERYASEKRYNITFDPIGGSISDCVVSLSAASYTYDGTAKTPTATLETKYGFVITPISVTYANNVNVGTATVTVTYTGDVYVSNGSKFTATFTIKEAGNGNSDNATITDESMAWMYDVMQEYGLITSSTSEVDDSVLCVILEVFMSMGFEEADAYKTLETYGISYPGAHEHSYTTKVTKATTSANGKITYTCSCGDTKTETIAKVSSATLSATSYTYNGKAKKPTVTVMDASGNKLTTSSYSVSYSNNVNAGTATATITLKGNYSGTIKKTYTIKAIAASKLTATLSATSYTYNGKAKKPTVTVKDASGNKLTTSSYSVSYSNNVNAGTATATITLKGNYSGTIKKTYTIKAIAASKLTATLSATSYTYNGKAKKPTVTVKDASGNTLTTSSYSVSYSNNVNAGTATATITLKGNYSGTIKKNYTIKAIAASKLTATLSATSYTYNGNARKPTVTVQYGSTKLVKGTDYTLTYASGRKNVGKYAVKITYKGNYSGSKTLYFKITPKKSAISSLTKGSKKITVKWSKISTQATGYQIRYSTSSSMSNAKTVTISSYKTTSKVLSGLNAKTKYYVQIRTYKTVDGTKYYSSWSTKQSVTTK